MKTDMAMISRVLEDVLPDDAFFVVLVGEVMKDSTDENCGFATDLAPDDAIRMMKEMTKSMEEQKPE